MQFSLEMFFLLINHHVEMSRLKLKHVFLFEQKHPFCSETYRAEIQDGALLGCATAGSYGHGSSRDVF